MTTAAESWDQFARKAKPRSLVNASGASTWFNWTQYADHGPDETRLGDVLGKHVLELGSGAGANLAHLATLGARCVGVDIAPSREATARARWGHLPNLEFVTADAVDYLRTPREFDVVYSVFGAVWFTDPAVLLPRVRRALTGGGRFAFSQVPVNAPKRAWDHPPQVWGKVLVDNGFRDVHTELIQAPRGLGEPTLLIHARA
jgi:SAM-dependent methyltransferase